MRPILQRVRQLLSSVAARLSGRPRPPGRPRRLRPQLEFLEGRLVPTGLVWQNPWDVSLWGGPVDGGSSSAAFGNVGAAGDVGPATAAASAFAQAWGIGGTFDDGPTYATSLGAVNFQRTFQVTGSATGWKVTLDGLLSGSLYASGDAWASVGARVRIIQGTPDAAGNVTHDLTFGPFFSGNVSGTREAVIADGTYTVIGSLAASATALGPPLGPTVGEYNVGWSDFAPSGLVATVAAVPWDDLASVSVSDAAFVEGNAGATTRYFTVALAQANDQTVTVDFALADGSATLADDDYGYPDANRTVTFAPGVTQQTIAVRIHGDRNFELNETFSVTLSNPTNARITDGQAVGTITDDEPRISINDVSKSEGRKNKTTLFTFTVTLSAAYDQAVTMSYRTVDGTAWTGDGDYIAKTGTLTFAAGETTKSITIEVKGDAKKEGNESFYLDLFGLSGNALFTRDRGIGTILNDD